jgi:predicted acetyltransferase
MRLAKTGHAREITMSAKRAGKLDQMILVVPALQYIPGYLAALRQGLTPRHSMKMIEAEIARIEKSPERFVKRFQAKERPHRVRNPDGSAGSPLRNVTRWLWDTRTDEFCGMVSFRWQEGTTSLPARELGHIGLYVMPGRQRQGYGMKAVRRMLELAHEKGLPHVVYQTTADNTPSRRLARKLGGTIIEALGGGDPDIVSYKIPVRASRRHSIPRAGAKVIPGRRGP